MKRLVDNQSWTRSDGKAGQLFVRALFSLVIAALIGGFWLASGSATHVDRTVRIWREQVFPAPASGKIALVEVDARSLAEISTWPWPRSVHGKIVDRLRQAGVETVAFDVDFSSHSSPGEDAAFASALARFDGTVILPTFRQNADSETSRTIDSEPIPVLRNHAMLASVNVFPDADGVMRRYSSGGITSGVPRPSMPALLAGSDGTTDESFWISNAVKPQTIPRYSAVDIVEGHFDKAALRGKTVLIGATAIEMGDRYATQAYGVQPGVVIQAMAAETLLQHLDYREYGPGPLALLALFLCCVIGCLPGGRSRVLATVGMTVMVAALPFLTEYLKWGAFGGSTALVMIAGTFAALALQDAAVRARQRRVTDGDTGLPNMLRLERDIGQHAGDYLFVMAIANLSELMALLGDSGKAQLYGALARRLRGAVGDAAVYLTDNGSLAWCMPFGNAADASEFAMATSSLLVSPIHPDDRPMIVRPAIGVECVSGSRPRETIQHAVLAANAAAASGHKWKLYSQSIADQSGHDQHILASVDDAIANGDIHFLFQPKYSFKAQGFCGAEALARWQHPDLGSIPPDEFIPVLERHGRLTDLTLHSLATIEPLLRTLADAGQSMHIAVNISAPLLFDATFAAQLEQRVQNMGSIRKMLTLEVTESASFEDDSTGFKLLAKLRQMGCRVSIDDYGTGNSTLSYLRRFPADEIKIDKSFVTNLVSDAADAKLVRSTIELAHELGMQVVAEGVEDASCAAALAEMDCDMAQGWHFGRPIGRADLEKLLNHPKSAAA